MFDEVRVRSLVDDKPVGVADVRQALGELATVGPDDVAIVFFAGHGVVRRDGEAAILTSGATASEASLEQHSFGWKVLGPALAAAKGRVLLLLDTCHSGAIQQSLVASDGQLAGELLRDGRAGAIVFTAAKGRQVSVEHQGHGDFTRAILEALHDPDTDHDRDHVVSVAELIDEVTRRVADGSHGQQMPWVARRETFGDFPLAPAP